MKTFILTLVLFSFCRALAQGCYNGDRQTGVDSRVERVSCTAYGYCRAYGHNPATGRYEYYDGYHPNCPGHQERSVTIYSCLNSLGVGYTVNSYGAWSSCRVH